MLSMFFERSAPPLAALNADVVYFLDKLNDYSPLLLTRQWRDQVSGRAAGTCIMS
jgi:hypothetical protein